LHILEENSWQAGELPGTVTWAIGIAVFSDITILKMTGFLCVVFGIIRTI